MVYDPRVAASLLGHLAGAINGAAVARGTSFLKDRLGQRVLPAGVTVVDDPTRRRGLRSRPFDGEGMKGVRRADRRGRRPHHLDPGLAQRPPARPWRAPATPAAAPAARPRPSPTNLWLEPGTVTPAALMADIREGLYVTELIGMGVNGVTGDYSRGAAGFMIRDGALAEPVSEITIAGNLRDMLLNLTPADDLVFRRGTDAPTVRVEGLTVAGA